MPHGTLYGLLVGIDAYERPIPPLRGCVNDVEAFEAFLRGRTEGEPRLRLLRNQEATRARVIAGFREHLSQAGPDDVALFYFSGHGSQEHAHQVFWHLEPDRLNETLVCHDSRQGDGRDLSDKELAKLLHEVAASRAHVVAVLDCCHSGSGTRGDLLADVAVRLADVDRRARPLASFEPVFTQAELRELAGREANAATVHHDGFFTLPEGRHVLLAACRSRQLAKEYRVGGTHHRGAFSHFLAQVLTTANRTLTYRDLFARARVRVETHVRDQSPVIEASVAADLDRPFLGGAVVERTGYLVHARRGEWLLDAGAVHGVTGPSQGETSRFALYDVDAPAAAFGDRSAAVGEADVVEVRPHESRLRVATPTLDASRTFRAVLISAPTPRTTVRLEGAPAAVANLRAAFATASGGGPSPFVRESGPDEVPTYRLDARDDAYLITRPADDRPILEPIAGGDAEANGREAVRRLECIGRWHDLAGLENVGSMIPANAVRFTLHHDGGSVDAASADGEVVLDYRSEDGAEQRPRFRLQLQNTTDRRLYAAVAVLSEGYGVETGLFPEGAVELPPQSEAWALGGRAAAASVPDDLWRAGVTERRDLLKLIVSTEPFDVTLLQQPGLEEHVPSGTRGRKGLRRDAGPLDRLLYRVATREVVPDDAAALADWMTVGLTIRVVRPQLAVATRDGGALAPGLGARVVVEPHPALRASVRLSSLAASARDLNAAHLSTDLIPAALLGEPDVASVFAFSTSRGLDPGLSVLELTDVEDAAAVSPEAPLVLTVDVTLDDGEHVLAYAHDGEFFLPLGASRASGVAGRGLDAPTRIELDRLPNPDALRTKSLSGAIRILFHKFVGQPLGRAYAYPLLRVARVADDGSVAYDGDADEVAAAVAAASRVLLFVHGIIGDTGSILPSVRRARLGRDGTEGTIGDAYDVVLAFDYESVHTSIAENAKLLKHRLEAAGLATDDGKTVHVVVHSMGGLVARWFIEEEGGHRLVDHLVMLGTPNDGSPWSGVQEWATTLVAFGLNRLAATFWPAKILAGLVALIERVDVNLDHMHPGSPFLAALADRPDPKVPYSLVAGSTSLRADAVTPPPGGTTSLVGRLLGRLRLEERVKDALTHHVFNESNDIAVSVRSATAIAPGRQPAPVVEEVASDHLSYFQSQAGLAALARALERADR